MEGMFGWLAEGGVIFNHVFSIGGAGYGIVNSPFYSSITYKDSTFSDVTLQGGFGGMQLEFFLKPMKVLHISFLCLLVQETSCWLQTDPMLTIPIWRIG